jgi:hypothetical protein
MAKIYLFMVVCIYNPSLSLEDTCKIVPMNDPFNSMVECLNMGAMLKNRIQLEMVNTYPTAFCSEKNFTST